MPDQDFGHLAIEDDEPVLECVERHRHSPLCFGLDDHEVEL